MKAVFKLLRILLLAALAVGLLLLGLILHATYTDFQPAPILPAATKGTAADTLPREFSFLIWNIGYSGLGKESDFFYDGGKRSIPTREWSSKNLTGITQYLSSHKTDFVLLQEVDSSSRRSYYADQVDAIAQALGSGYNTTFAPNYKVSFVPLPFTQPMGKVLSGLVSYSRFKATENTRYQLPGSFEWPKSVYFLDRCVLLQRYPLPNGKDLVVVNTHHSAYDGGKLKEHEMAFVRKLYLDEYQKGNYVIVGGDWNQAPPKFDPNTFLKSGKPHNETSLIPDSYLPGWMWVYDPKTPTNRGVATPYDPAVTYTTVIDFYLLSPNVELVSVEGVDLQFEFSDHQPLQMKVRLRPDDQVLPQHKPIP